MVSALAIPVEAATNAVTTLADNGPGSLRHAISNALPGDCITFSTFGAIALTSGELLIDKNLKIIGPGASNMAVSGNRSTRIFNISAGVTGSISGLTIHDGLTTNGLSGSAPSSSGTSGAPGGGIFNSGTLLLLECIIASNMTGSGGNGANGSDGVAWASSGGHGGDGGFGGYGGAIYNVGSLCLDACVFSGNSTGGGGSGGVGGAPGPCSPFQPPGCGGRGHGGKGGLGGGGGAIWNDRGTITATRCTFTANACGNAGSYAGPPYSSAPEGPGGSGGSGGAIGNGSIGSGPDGSVLTVSGCVFSGNDGGNGIFGSIWGYGGNGGAIFNANTALVSVCTFSSNLAFYGANGAYEGYGGAVFSFGQLTISSCTFNQNWSGGHGGGIFSLGTLNLSNSTISQNLALSGLGSIFSTGLLRIVSCTVVSNTSLNGGIGVNIYNCTAFLRNSLIAYNKLQDLCCTGFISEGHNLIGDGLYAFSPPGPGDFSTNDVRLAPLAANGGPTLTHGLLLSSPALDAGDDSLIGSDQRGRPRLSGTHADIGAYEFAVPTPPYLSGPYRLHNGAFQFTFTNTSDANFSVLATTNVSLPVTQWLNLGSATLVTNGFYQFDDPGATNNPHRFFQLRWP